MARFPIYDQADAAAFAENSDSSVVREKPIEIGGGHFFMAARKARYFAALLRMDALACSCIWAGPFFTAGAREELIVRATVVRYTAHAMDREVHETFKGNPGDTTMKIPGQ